MSEQEYEHKATMQEAVDEWRYNVGGEKGNEERAWLLHDWDVWVKNPHYCGPPVPHPEDEAWDAARIAELEANGLTTSDAQGVLEAEKMQAAQPQAQQEVDDNDCPF